VIAELIENLYGYDTKEVGHLTIEEAKLALPELGCNECEIEEVLGHPFVKGKEELDFSTLARAIVSISFKVDETGRLE